MQFSVTWKKKKITQHLRGVLILIESPRKMAELKLCENHTWYFKTFHSVKYLSNLIEHPENHKIIWIWKLNFNQRQSSKDGKCEVWY